MDKRFLNEIRRVKQMMHLKESDIEGIDELVYNPATKSGGEIGHGYDRGKRVEGITWNGHDNHAHIAFTNKEVAMAVIDKADSLGLKTTENPYAKRDPNNKVDRVHTLDSFHYQNFEGTPLVGKAVDISGDKDKIIELIKWIEETYTSGAVSYPAEKTTDSESTDEEKELLDKILDSEFQGKKVRDILDDENIIEPIKDSAAEFLKNLRELLDFFTGLTKK